MLSASGSAYVQGLFERRPSKKPAYGQKKAIVTVSNTFRTQLQDLMRKVHATQPHFVRAAVRCRVLA